jgi:hypothetical protein
MDFLAGHIHRLAVSPPLFTNAALFGEFRQEQEELNHHQCEQQILRLRKFQTWCFSEDSQGDLPRLADEAMLQEVRDFLWYGAATIVRDPSGKIKLVLSQR